LLENVADSVSNGGLEGYASRVESRKVYANELAWLEDCVHRQMFTLSQGKCKCAAWHHDAFAALGDRWRLINEVRKIVSVNFFLDCRQAA
jgi:hypothetical protein